MNIALCYENVDPTRGGCETYIADFARRLVADGHEVHLYACRWNAAALLSDMVFHPLPRPAGPRFLRPWRFGHACLTALREREHDVSIGFDKTWGQDVLYPQGGVYAASQAANVNKHAGTLPRLAARCAKALDPAVQSFLRLERRQYCNAPTVIVNSEMVRRHAQQHLGLEPSAIHVVHAAVDPSRFDCGDRPAIRQSVRSGWGVAEQVPVGVFVAMNYRLKGLEPLLHSLRHVAANHDFRIVVVGNPNFAVYQRLAAWLGVADRVIFHGFCADSRRAYFAADFLVHPTFYDPCSLVVLEALACGLPVITTRFNGASELMHPPHDGLVIDDPHDHPPLARAIERMLDADFRREAIRQAAHTATLWTFDNHYRKMMAVVEEVAARKRAAVPLPSAA